MEPQLQNMRKSSSVRHVDMPQINTGLMTNLDSNNQQQQQQQQSINRMILEEQASQTLKFHPSKEAMTVTNLRSQAGAPPLPNNQGNNRRPLNSERGCLRDNQHPLLPQQSHGGQQVNENIFYNTGTTNQHQQLQQHHLSSTADGDQQLHYQSTDIEQNVMMFDNTTGQQNNLEMSSAFDHIQDELTKLNDQLLMTSGGAPRSTKAVTTKKSNNNNNNARLLSAAAPGVQGNQNHKRQSQSQSRSASRSRQIHVMNRLAQGQSTTITTTTQTSARQQSQQQKAAGKSSGRNKIRTHARLNSMGHPPTQHATQESQRSLRQQSSKQPTLRRKKSCSSHNRARSRPRATYDTIQQPQQQQTEERQRLGKPRSQRSFSNLPMRRLSRARSKSTRALGSHQTQNSGGRQTAQAFDPINMTQQPMMLQQQFYTQKVAHQNENRTYIYSGDNSSMMLMPGGGFGVSSADQTIMAAQSNYRTTQDGGSSLVNILTAAPGGHGGVMNHSSAAEPPQYLVAHDSSFYDQHHQHHQHHQQQSAGEHHNESAVVKEEDMFNNANNQQSMMINGVSGIAPQASQIEQIMARYEQLCQKLDSQSQTPQDHLIVNDAGQIVFKEPSVHADLHQQQALQQQQQNQSMQQQQQEGSLDMYIAQHEESMMQESVGVASSVQYQPQAIDERQQTLDSPARHIGPREYIEILSGKQEERCLKNGILLQNGANANNESSLLHQMESEIGLAENHLGVTASQFNQMSSMVEDVKEGTSHFQGIALTTSELNNYQDSQAVMLQQQVQQRNGSSVGPYQDDYEQNKENDDQQINNASKTASSVAANNNNLLAMESHAPNTQQTSKHGGYNNLRSGAAMSGQQTHGQASVTSYNTADFTKLSINQQDILSNQKSSKGLQQNQPQQQPQQQTQQQMPQQFQGGNSVAMAMSKLQDRAEKLEDGLRSAMQIILQLGQQLNEVQGAMDPLNDQLRMERVEELDTIESVIDLLAFMRNDKRNLLVRNPQIQQVVQNSLHLFQPQLKQQQQQQQNQQASYNNGNNKIHEQVSMGEPLTNSESKVLLNIEKQQSSGSNINNNYRDPKTAAQKQMLLTMFSTSMVGGGTEQDSTSPPAQQRCATEMSALIGSPVGVLDLSAVNQFSQQTTSNVKNLQQTANQANTLNQQMQMINPVNCFTNQQIQITQQRGSELPPSMDTVKLVGPGAYNQVKPFETSQTQTTTQQTSKPNGGSSFMKPTHDRVNSQQNMPTPQAVVQPDGQLLTLRNQKIFEADESNIFSQTMSPNHDQSRRQNNTVTHLFSQEEESSISHQKTSGRQQTQQLTSCQENAVNTGRGGTSAGGAAELSFDSVFSKEPLARRQQQQKQQMNAAQQALQQQATTMAGPTAFQGYSPVILNRVSEISSSKQDHQAAGQSAAKFVTANFVEASSADKSRQNEEDESSVTSSARSSVFNAANQSLSQQELTDIMFASVRNPAKLGYGVVKNDDGDGNNDDGSNVGILTAMAQKRRQGMGHQQQANDINLRLHSNNNPHHQHNQQHQDQATQQIAAAPWKSLNLSKLNHNHHHHPAAADHSNNRQVQAVKPVAANTTTTAGGGPPGFHQTTAENRRHKGYNNDNEEEDGEDDLEEASRILTLDDFSPNFISQKPILQQQHYLNSNQQPQQQLQQQQTLVSFRRMTNRAAPETMQSQASSSHAERVAAALVMSSGPTTTTEYNDDDDDYQPPQQQQSEMASSRFNAVPPGVVAPSQAILAEGGGAAGDGGQMTSLEDARSKFLGGFTSLKSEISQLKQTILNND